MRKYLVILCGLLIFNLAIAEEAVENSVEAKSVKAEEVKIDYNKKELNRDGYNVKDIEVVDNKEIPEDVIFSLMSTKKDETFSAETLLKDYNKIKNQDYIESVSMYPKVVEGGIKITVVLNEKKDTKKLLQDKGIIPNSEREYVDSTLVVSDVVIKGLKNLSKDELKGILPIKTGGYFSERKVSSGQRAFLETGKFTNVTYEVIKNTNGATVIYNVVENPILNGINIIGNTIYTTEELLALINTKPGEVFSINTIREDRTKILNKYYDNGYILADIIDIDINNNMELEFTIVEGTAREVTFKKMITKNKGDRRKASDDILKTKDFVVEREIEIEEGKVFNIKEYDETSANLMRTGIFKNVKYEANNIPGDADGKSLVLLLEEERTASLQGAVSYGSEVGLLGMLSIKDDNWAGRAQKSSISFEKSDEGYSSFSVNFYDPWIRGTDRLSWGWSLYKTDSEVDDSYLFNEMSTYGAKINVGKGISKFVRLGLGTKLEYVTEDNKNGDREDEYLQGSLFPSITYDTRNNPMNPTKGEYAKYQIEGGYAGGNDADFFGNNTLELRKYHRFLGKSNTNAYRLVTGIMTDTTKESQRFWVGGNSLRGYDGGFFQGTQKIVGTIENRTQINDVLGFVLFMDAGRAWEQNGKDPGYEHDANFGEEIGVAAGVGIRLNTPMGPLRFDFGWPVGEKIDDEGGMQFFFNMGQSF